MAATKQITREQEEDALQKLIRLLEKEVPPLLLEKRNFKIVINGSAGQTLKVEVTKYLDA